MDAKDQYEEFVRSTEILTPAVERLRDELKYDDARIGALLIRLGRWLEQRTEAKKQ